MRAPASGRNRARIAVTVGGAVLMRVNLVFLDMALEGYAPGRFGNSARHGMLRSIETRA